MLALLALPIILPQACVKPNANNKKGKEKGTKKAFRPSAIESSESFIYHIKSTTELDSCFDQRQNKCFTLGITLQPFIIVVGNDFRSITASYVMVNKYRYLVDSPLHAVDVCFKIYHALSADYSPECSNTWFFLQKGFYKIETEFDPDSTVVNSRLTDLEID